MANTFVTEYAPYFIVNEHLMFTDYFGLQKSNINWKKARCHSCINPFGPTHLHFQKNTSGMICTVIIHVIRTYIYTKPPKLVH